MIAKSCDNQRAIASKARHGSPPRSKDVQAPETGANAQIEERLLAELEELVAEALEISQRTREFARSLKQPGR